jgi:hypothetical protein
MFSAPIEKVGKSGGVHSHAWVNRRHAGNTLVNEGAAMCAK